MKQTNVGGKTLNEWADVLKNVKYDDETGLPFPCQGFYSAINTLIDGKLHDEMLIPILQKHVLAAEGLDGDLARHRITGIMTNADLLNYIVSRNSYQVPVWKHVCRSCSNDYPEDYDGFGKIRTQGGSLVDICRCGGIVDLSPVRARDFHACGDEHLFKNSSGSMICDKCRCVVK